MLGGWYFNGNTVPVGDCNDSIPVVQENGAFINNHIGLINLFQCGTFSIAEEGVYTCKMMNSSMMNQSIRLGLYLTERSK